jgi:hypothetical protein
MSIKFPQKTRKDLNCNKTSKTYGNLTVIWIYCFGKNLF